MRRRLVLAIVAVAATAVVVFAVPLGVVLSHSYRDRELLRLQRDTIAATRQIDVSTSVRDPIELPPSADALTVYDRAGRRIAGDGASVAYGLVRTALDGGRPSDALEGGRLVTAVPLVVGERVTGVVLATRDAASVARSSRDAWLALAGLAAVLVALSGVAALVLGRRLARPLERLAGAARQLGDGDFAVRAPRAGVAEVDAVAGALDTTATRLGTLVERERAFSADASHQLRTPLAALRLELEAIGLRDDEPPELPELPAALAQVDRLEATITTLLSVGRDRPRGVQQEEADLALLLPDLEQRWRGVLAASGRPLRTAISGPRPIAVAAPGVVREILDVLVSNAHRHGAGTVTVAVRDAEGWIAVDVSDEGTGFRDPSTAFDRRSGNDGGHGIGLALARSLAVAEGARLTIARPGPAPRLTLLLPRRGYDPPEADGS